jgi:glutaredoxin
LPVDGATTVTLYSRPGCHLCELAREALERVAAAVAFELREVEITGDDELHRRYLERIPVVAIAGEELFEYSVDEDVLRQRLLYRGPR